jgi:hypothetical protein
MIGSRSCVRALAGFNNLELSWNPPVGLRGSMQRLEVEVRRKRR